MIIHEVDRPHWRDVGALLRPKPSTSTRVAPHVEIVGSGKGAIALILKYLRAKGVLKNKLDELIVPDWLGYWVYNLMQPWAFPCKRYSDRSKAILVYHQYGFPQNLEKILDFAHDKNLIVIEDCAHALKSFYHGQELGTFGDFALYSYSKWFFCFALGGVRSRDQDFVRFVQDELRGTPWGFTLYKDFSKWFSDVSRFMTSRAFQKIANNLLVMAYAVYDQALKPSKSAVALRSQKLEKEILLRQRRYHYFIQQTERLGICDHLDRTGVTPYVIPVITRGKNQALVNAFREKGIATGTYQFDVNQNMLDPRFEECVWVPVHSGISDTLFSDLTDLTVSILSL